MKTKIRKRKIPTTTEGMSKKQKTKNAEKLKVGIVAITRDDNFYDTSASANPLKTRGVLIADKNNKNEFAVNQITSRKKKHTKKYIERNGLIKIDGKEALVDKKTRKKTRHGKPFIADDLYYQESRQLELGVVLKLFRKIFNGRKNKK